MNVAVASLVEPIQVPHNYNWRKSQIKKTPNCVFASSSSGSVGTLVIETNQDQQQQQQISTSTETPTTLSSVAARRLILLRHAKSSWENRSIRGTHLLATKILKKKKSSWLIMNDFDQICWNFVLQLLYCVLLVSCYVCYFIGVGGGGGLLWTVFHWAEMSAMSMLLLVSGV